MPTKALRQMGVDEIYLGKQQKFLTVVNSLQTDEPLWIGRERKQATLGARRCAAIPPGK